jgi:hypothetical protein
MSSTRNSRIPENYPFEKETDTAAGYFTKRPDSHQQANEDKLSETSKSTVKTFQDGKKLDSSTVDDDDDQSSSSVEYEDYQENDDPSSGDKAVTEGQSRTRSTVLATTRPSTVEANPSVTTTVSSPARVLVPKAVLEDKDELTLTLTRVGGGNTGPGGSSSGSGQQHPRRHQAARHQSRTKKRNAPYFEREGKAVVSAAEGGSAILHCRVRNLGQLAVSF